MANAFWVSISLDLPKDPVNQILSSSPFSDKNSENHGVTCAESPPLYVSKPERNPVF